MIVDIERDAFGVARYARIAGCANTADRSSGLAAIFQASACSRPPEPRSRIFIVRPCRGPFSTATGPQLTQEVAALTGRRDGLLRLCLQGFARGRTVIQGCRSLFKSMNEPRLNLPELTVSELSAALKRTIEDAYGFVRVRGELGKVSYHSNGHVYFDLKDDRACISGVIWRSTATRIKLKLEAGLEVVVTGRLTTYPGRSQYQIIVETLEPAGLGALMALLEERKRRLTAEGLFDEARKQLLPYLPTVIGVITSPTGAVIRDILHRLADRFPRHVIVWPVKVQGEGSAREVTAAIAGFNAFPEKGSPPRPDLLIVARGGGSLEDLWSFNEEIVVRAAARELHSADLRGRPRDRRDAP